MLCLSFSPGASLPSGTIFHTPMLLGGYFVAAGSSDSVIRVYSFHTYSPLKICELDRHTVREAIELGRRTNDLLCLERGGNDLLCPSEQLFHLGQ